MRGCVRPVSCSSFSRLRQPPRSILPRGGVSPMGFLRWLLVTTRTTRAARSNSSADACGVWTEGFRLPGKRDHTTSESTFVDTAIVG